MRPNIAAAAPMPSPSVITAMAENPGFLRSWRSAKRKSSYIGILTVSAHESPRSLYETREGCERLTELTRDSGLLRYQRLLHLVLTKRGKHERLRLQIRGDLLQADLQDRKTIHVDEDLRVLRLVVRHQGPLVAIKAIVQQVDHRIREMPVRGLRGLR